MNTLSIALDIFNMSVVPLAIAFVVIFAIAMLLAFLRRKVVYVDPETDFEIYRKKYPLFSKVKLIKAEKPGKTFVGWSFEPDASVLYRRDTVRVKRGTKLYAVWGVEKEIPSQQPQQEVKNNTGIKFVYIDDITGKQLAVEIHKFNIATPDKYDGNEKFLGWALKPGADPIIEKGGEGANLKVELYPTYVREDVEEEVKEVVEEPVIEPVVEEPTNTGIEFVYIDNNTGKELATEIHRFNIATPDKFDDEFEFLGWALKPGADPIIDKGGEGANLKVELYPTYVRHEVEEEVEEVIEEPVELIEEPVEEKANAGIEFAYMDDTGKEIATDVYDVNIKTPEEYEEKDKFLGWALKPDEEPIFEKGTDVSKLRVELYPVYEKEPVVEEVVQPVVEEPVENDDDDMEVMPAYFDSEGNQLNIRYSRSVTANIIQADDTVKDYYNEIKNHILMYKGVKSRMSWKFDSFNKGRDQLFKLKIRGKTICLYCALNPYEFDKTKYHHEAIDAKIFEEVPMLIKIRSGLGLKKAKEIVDITMQKHTIELDPKAKTVDYIAKYPYEENEPLIEKKLIKIIVSDVQEGKLVIGKVVDGPAEGETIESVIEQQLAEEKEEKIAEENANESVKPAETVEEMKIVEQVSAEEVDSLVTDEVAESLVEEDVEYVESDDTKKAIINIDTLSDAYKSGEVVDLESLKEKKLIDKKSKSVKILARGTLNKSLTVKAGEFSKPALKMILLTGGKCIHTVSKEKDR